MLTKNLQVIFIYKLSILQLQTIFCKKVMLQQTKTFLIDK